MTAPVDITSTRSRVLAPTDCGLCTHPVDGHDASECSAVNAFGQCTCWWYVPAVQLEARGAAA